MRCSEKDQTPAEDESTKGPRKVSERAIHTVAFRTGTDSKCDESVPLAYPFNHQAPQAMVDEQNGSVAY
jgi:hypothetical protein